MRRRNPDDRTRDLERAAAAGDPRARMELGIARARSGQCSDCATTLPTDPPPGGHVVPVAVGNEGQRHCIACAAELDLGIVGSRRPVHGYLAAAEHVSSLSSQWPRTADNNYAVTNFMGFPLLAVTELAGISGGYTGRSLAYSAVDTSQLPWYGRASAVGHNTTARPKSQERAERWLLRGRRALAEAQAEWLQLAREDPTGALLHARGTWSAERG